ncbi:hypothetical protein P9112_003494 [Eukaryota sp. TZLM1-RC]
MTSVQISPESVLRSFVDQYFSTLCKEPDNVNRFYGEESTLTVSEYGSSFISDVYTGRDAIDQFIKSSNMSGKSFHIASVDYTPFDSTSMMVVVNGSVVSPTSNTDVRAFQNSFILTAHEDHHLNGWFYLRASMFRWNSPEPEVSERNVTTPCIEVEATSPSVPATIDTKAERKPHRERKQDTIGTPRPKHLVIELEGAVMADVDAACREFSNNIDIMQKQPGKFRVVFYQPDEAENIIQNGLVINGVPAKVSVQQQKQPKRFRKHRN